jgi:integrase
VVAYHLGRRTGELLALKRSWVDLTEGLIYVQGRVTKNRTPQTAPIYGDMGPWLEMTLSRGQAESPKCMWLFSRAGKPVKDFKADWKQACEQAGVPKLLFYDLRRTAVRNLIRAGVPEKIAMQISGHKTVSMLWRYNITDARDIKKRRESVWSGTSRHKTGHNMQDYLRSTFMLSPAKWCPGRDLNPHSPCGEKDFTCRPQKEASLNVCSGREQVAGGY